MELVQEGEEIEGNKLKKVRLLLARENLNQRKFMKKKRGEEQLSEIPPRKKALAKKSKAKQLPTTTAHCTFISVEAKATFSEFKQNKQVIKERTLAWGNR